jgi:hypothetical protein
MENIETLKAELKELKTQHHDVLEKLEEKKMEIALSECPLKIGEKVKLIYPDKEIEGEITHIHYCYKNIVDQVLNNVDSFPTWGVQGRRINKTSGEVGKWGFSANPIFFDYDDISKTFTQKKDILMSMLNDD